jgi:hypothetical protein
MTHPSIVVTVFVARRYRLHERVDNHNSPMSSADRGRSVTVRRPANPIRCRAMHDARGVSVVRHADLEEDTCVASPRFSALP